MCACCLRGRCDIRPAYMMVTMYHVSRRPVHLPYSSVFSTESHCEYGNTDLLAVVRNLLY